jgi:predicted protein tyrosine phosphatase
MRLLFICNENDNRSKTAEEMFRGEFETRSAGLHNQTPVTAEELQWADTIIVMEDVQGSELTRRFPELYLQRRIRSLDIRDIYQYMQPELKTMLNEKMQDLF